MMLNYALIFFSSLPQNSDKSVHSGCPNVMSNSTNIALYSPNVRIVFLYCSSKESFYC